MIRFLNNVWENESGVTSVEYALLAAAAAVVLSVAGGNFYTKVSGAFDDISLSGETDTADVPG
ncbi:MAG: Flp family type IVb pilin [Sneathiella sp.]